MPKPPETARGGAVQLLNAVLIERRLMAEIIASGVLQDAIRRRPSHSPDCNPEELHRS